MDLHYKMKTKVMMRPMIMRWINEVHLEERMVGEAGAQIFLVVVERESRGEEAGEHNNNRGNREIQLRGIVKRNTSNNSK